MTKKSVFYGLTIFMFVCVATGFCHEKTPRLQAVVSILPQKYFVEKIGKDLLDVLVMVQPGENPHLYEPKPKHMIALSKSVVYFAIGVGFEQVWLRKISDMNPQMRVVRTDDRICKIPMASNPLQGKDGKEPKPGISLNKNRSQNHYPSPERPDFLQNVEPVPDMSDPHIWTSPPLVKIQAENILHALLEIDPGHHLDYIANFNAFIQEIDDMDREFRRLFQGKEGLQFMVFHPAWGYFAQTYKLKQVPVEIEGKEPKPAQIQHLIQQAKMLGIKVVFVQPQLSFKSAQTIADAINGNIVFADPLAYDWTDNLRKQAAAFKDALR